ncbi:hypothetical protein OROGR_031349 [Orobanche gracilis]
MELESSLTEMEMEAVLQLIQLSGGFADDDIRVFWVNFPAEKEIEEKSGCEASSSSSIDRRSCTSGEALPRRKKRFASLVDIYRKTRPLVEKYTARF